MKRLFTLILFLSIFAAISCSHEDPEYPVKIYVKLDSSEAPVPDADVRIPEVSKGDSAVWIKTNESGVASYTFKLPAILEIRAISPDGTMWGESTVRLKEDETVVKTIYIK